MELCNYKYPTCKECICKDCFSHEECCKKCEGAIQGCEEYSQSDIYSDKLIFNKEREKVKEDVPSCNFEKCKYNENLNCTKPSEFEKCSRGRIFTLTEKVYEKYPDDKDIWTLLQEVVRIGQAINKICDEFDLKQLN